MRQMGRRYWRSLSLHEMKFQIGRTTLRLDCHVEDRLLPSALVRTSVSLLCALHPHQLKPYFRPRSISVLSTIWSYSLWKRDSLLPAVDEARSSCPPTPLVMAGESPGRVVEGEKVGSGAFKRGFAAGLISGGNDADKRRSFVGGRGGGAAIA